MWQWLGDALIDRAQLVNRTFAKVAVISPTILFTQRLQAARPDWQITHTQALPEESSCDALIILGLPAIVNDVPALLHETRAALTSDGLFLAGFYGGQSLVELRTVLLQAESALRDGAASRVAPMIDANSAANLMQRAGFALPVVDHTETFVSYAHLGGLIDDLRAANATAVLQTVQPLPRALFGAASDAYQQQFTDARGRYVASLQGVFVSGWKA